MESYELHHFKNEALPLIFHMDTVEKNQRVIPNWHENIELLYCISGSGEVLIDSNSVPMHPGILNVINSDCLHHVRSFSEKLVYYCLIPDSDLLERFDLPVGQRMFAETVESEGANCRFERIIREMKDSNLCFEAVVRGEIIALIADLIRNFSTPSKEKGKSDMVKKGMKYLKQHFSEPLTLETVADATGFSRYYFCREFKSKTGYTVNQYLQFLRCRKAELLLREEHCSVSDAALECGFDDVSYFTKVFKREMGLLPSALKKEKKNEENLF